MKRCIIIFIVLFGGVYSQLYGPNRAQTISNIFQIPIQTLTAISNVVQNTRPIGEIIQRRRPQLSQPPQQSNPSQFNGSPQQFVNQFSSQPYNSLGNYISRAARIAGLYAAPDGSAFKI